MLLQDIRDIFNEREADEIPSKELAGALCEIEGSPWAEWNHGKGLTANTLARQLKKFHIHPGTIWINNSNTPKGYKRPDFEDAWKRYCPSPPKRNASPPEPAPPLDETPVSETPAPPGMAFSKNGSDPHKHRAAGGMAFQSEGVRKNEDSVEPENDPDGELKI